MGVLIGKIIIRRRKTKLHYFSSYLDLLGKTIIEFKILIIL